MNDTNTHKPDKTCSGINWETADAEINLLLGSGDRSLKEEDVLDGWAAFTPEKSITRREQTPLNVKLEISQAMAVVSHSKKQIHINAQMSPIRRMFEWPEVRAPCLHNNDIVLLYTSKLTELVLHSNLPITYAKIQRYQNTIKLHAEARKIILIKKEKS